MGAGAALWPWRFVLLAFVALQRSSRQAAFGVLWVFADARPGIECSLDDQQSLCGTLPLPSLGGILLGRGLGRHGFVEFALLVAADGASRCPLLA